MQTFIKAGYNCVISSPSLFSLSPTTYAKGMQNVYLEFISIDSSWLKHTSPDRLGNSPATKNVIYGEIYELNYIKSTHPNL
jgi:hypothetical protein